MLLNVRNIQHVRDYVFPCHIFFKQSDKLFLVMFEIGN